MLGVGVGWARQEFERSGLGRVVFALSNDQLAGLQPGGGRPDVPREGPALYAEARVPLESYYG